MPCHSRTREDTNPFQEQEVLKYVAHTHIGIGRFFLFFLCFIFLYWQKMTNTKAPLPIQHMILTMGIRDNVKQLSKKGGGRRKTLWNSKVSPFAFRTSTM